MKYFKSKEELIKLMGQAKCPYDIFGNLEEDQLIELEQRIKEAKDLLLDDRYHLHLKVFGDWAKEIIFDETYDLKEEFRSSITIKTVLVKDESYFQIERTTLNGQQYFLIKSLRGSMFEGYYLGDVFELDSPGMEKRSGYLSYYTKEGSAHFTWEGQERPSLELRSKDYPDGIFTIKTKWLNQDGLLKKILFL